MKKLLICSIVALSIAVGFVATYSYREHRKTLCASWLASAEVSQSEGYHARAIDMLTLYFSEENCRGKSDPSAIRTLVAARPHVPLPEGNELVQQLSLSRLGWQLERDPSFQLTQAKAALARSDWEAALDFADYSDGQQAILIKIAAAVRLKDWHQLQGTLTDPGLSLISDFQLALASEMLVDAPVNLPARPIKPGLEGFAKMLLRGSNSEIVERAALVKHLLTIEDLGIAANLLTAVKHSDALISLLDQPKRRLPSSLLKKIAYQYWVNENYDALLQFSDREIQGALSGEIALLVCLAERELEGTCTTLFDEEDYSARHGQYASMHWQNLFRLLRSSKTPAHEIIDALVAMEDLVRKEPVAYQLLASLYAELGEIGLADRYEQAALLFGLTPVGRWYHEAAPLWTSKLSKGYMPSQTEVLALETVSPEQSILWRLAKSRLALSKGTDEGAAEALRVIRPVLGWAPEMASAQLIAASSTAHFGDHDASYGHLMNAVFADPKSTVAALRLSLHFYQETNGLTATELNHWWESLTRAEIGNKDPENARSFIIERAMILAAVAEEEQDPLLAQNAYRTILKEQPTNHVALNNLAVWLTQNPSTLDDAKKMAETAIALKPEQAEYQATLQDIEAAIEEADNYEAF